MLQGSHTSEANEWWSRGERPGRVEGGCNVILEDHNKVLDCLLFIFQRVNFISAIISIVAIRLHYFGEQSFNQSSSWICFFSKSYTVRGSNDNNHNNKNRYLRVQGVIIIVSQ